MPEYSQKNDDYLTVFENGKQTHYALCADCASVKLKDKAYIPLQSTPIFQFRLGLSVHSTKYQCPNCKNFSYFHVRSRSRLSFCIRCNTCFSNESGKITDKNRVGYSSGRE